MKIEYVTFDFQYHLPGNIQNLPWSGLYDPEDPLKPGR
jgi:hypothetical protein